MSNRHNQDQYDVIQAKEEWDSMHLPRNVQQVLAKLQAKCDMLEEENAALRAENEELENFKFIYEGLS